MDGVKRMEIINPPSPSSSHSDSLSIELERNANREKLEHFKVLIRQLQQELYSNKIRKEGVETVSRLLQESKQENVSLQKRARAMEAAIRNLQSRLEQHGLSSQITLDEDETYLPGHSKHLLDNLTRENIRLRNIIRNAPVDIEEFSRLQQEVVTLQHNCARLEEKGKEYQEKSASSVEAVLGSSDSNKDRAISELRQALDQSRQECHSREIICQSLQEERSRLRQQLNEVVVKCQEMACQLHEKDRTDSKIVEVKQSVQVSGNNTEEIKRLQDEIRQLKVQNDMQIMEVNQQWQEYNRQQVSMLEATNKDLREQLEKASNLVSKSVLDKAKKEAEEANKQKRQIEEELSQTHQNLIRMSEEIEALKTKQISSVSKSHQETISALKAQIQICTEDFESERRDREKAQSKIAQFEADIEQLRRENEQLKKARVQEHFQQQNYVDPFYHYQLPGPHGNFSGREHNLAARGVERSINDYNVIDGLHTDGVNHELKSISEPELKQLTSKNNSYKPSSPSTMSLPPQYLLSMENSPQRSPTRETSPKSNDVLRCPKCSKEYTSDKHADLLEHIDICCE
ncbi:hypothetical protein ACJMK2_004835 [Sinanodonta woodiana]|uniref:NF-kappa-B essential modulator NEMO CC2-LZ domain-containing protein n=1 Tax=Sinanodonta woodiana TaxID=1069815 RepID=A0ABD3VR74_SINWO